MIRSITPENTAKQMFKDLDATLKFQSNENKVMLRDSKGDGSDDSESCLDCLRDC